MSFLAGHGSYHAGLTSCWPYAAGTTSTETPIANNRLNILTSPLNSDRFIEHLLLSDLAPHHESMLARNRRNRP